MKQLKENRVNFLQRYEDAVKQSKKSKTPKIFIWAPIVTLVILLAIGALPLARVMLLLEPQILLTRAYTDNPANIAAYADALVVYEDRDTVVQAYNYLNEAYENINTYPEFSREVYELLTDAAGSSRDIYSLSYTRSNGLLIISGTCTDVLDVSDYVATLRASDGLVNVIHYGYSLTGDEDSVYEFQVYCAIPADGGNDNG